MIYSIVNIELLIRYNNITGVYTLLSTGQIIPFVMGIASLWKTCWQIMLVNVELEDAGVQREQKINARGHSSGTATVESLRSHLM